MMQRFAGWRLAFSFAGVGLLFAAVGLAEYRYVGSMNGAGIFTQAATGVVCCVLAARGSA